jgi:hypothetical protein
MRQASKEMLRVATGDKRRATDSSAVVKGAKNRDFGLDFGVEC